MRNIRAAAEVIQGHVEVIRKGNEDRKGWLVPAIFVELIHADRHTGNRCDLRLRKIMLDAQPFKGILKAHKRPSINRR